MFVSKDVMHYYEKLKERMPDTLEEISIAVEELD